MAFGVGVAFVFFGVGVAGPASLHSIFPVSMFSTPMARMATGVGVAGFTGAGVVSVNVTVGCGVVACTNAAAFFAGVGVATGVDFTSAGVAVGFGVGFCFGRGVGLGHSQFPVLPL